MVGQKGSEHASKGSHSRRGKAKPWAGAEEGGVARRRRRQVRRDGFDGEAVRLVG